MSQQPKRAPLSSLAEFAAPKGAATATPDAAIEPPATPSPVPLPALSIVPVDPRPARSPRADRPVPAPPPVQAPQYGETPRGRVQLGLRLDPARHDRLREIAFHRRVPIQTILDELIDSFLAGEG